MFAAWFLGLFLSALTIAFHYEVVHVLSVRIGRLGQYQRRRIVLAVLILFLAHVAEIWLFAGGHYAAVEWFSLGELKGEFSGAIREYAYFSVITYTTVGYGDITPTGEVRILAGLESLTGLMMIAWSAAFTVFRLERRWSSDTENKPD